MPIDDGPRTSEAANAATSDTFNNLAVTGSSSAQPLIVTSHKHTLDRVAEERANVVQASVNIVTVTLPARSQATAAAPASTVGALLESGEPEEHANVGSDSVRGMKPW
jgi:hypothetical protein